MNEEDLRVWDFLCDFYGFCLFFFRMKLNNFHFLRGSKERQVQGKDTKSSKALPNAFHKSISATTSCESWPSRLLLLFTLPDTRI